MRGRTSGSRSGARPAGGWRFTSSSSRGGADTLSRRRRLLLFAAKLAVAALLIGWLLRSGTLDLGALSLLFERPALLVANLAVFVASVVLVSLRWPLLLRLAGVHVPFWRALQLGLDRKSVV